MPKISFTSRQKNELSGRSGEFILGNKKFKTPKFFPIINIMTGSPGVFGTGGIWRGIKQELIKKTKIEAFMTQILHFLDYNISKNVLNNWLEIPLDERIKSEAGYKPLIFADSGGYKLLFTDGIDTSKFGFSPKPNDILKLQLKFGADFIATLDYPIPPNLSHSEVLDRKRKSINNSIETLKIIKNKRLNDEKFVFIPVHGYDFSSSFRYVKKTLEEIKRNNLSNLNFGLAIGSLVPISSSHQKVVDIVAGVIQALRDDKNFIWQDIPVHTFGVSGFMMPILAVMGVDSFDSSGFAQSANNLIYMKKFGRTGINFYDLKEEDIECDCRYCSNFKKGSLSEIQEIMHGKSYVEHSLNGTPIKKYRIYSWIACHNYNVIENTIKNLGRNIEKGEAIQQLLDLYKSERRMLLLLGYLTKYYENLADSLLEYNLLRLSGKKVDFGNIEWKETLKIADVSKDNFQKIENEISLLYTPEDYNILERTYKPEGKNIMLLTSCSKEKPYSSSRTLKAIKENIQGWDNKIEMVVISGMYGPVPLSDELEPNVIGYNYRLSTSNEKRIELLTNRLLKFLDKHGESFDHVVAYVTSKPYRILMENVAQKFEKLEVLPKNLKYRGGKEFTKKKNLMQLNDYVNHNLRQEED